MNKKKRLIGAGIAVLLILCMVIIFFRGSDNKTKTVKVGLILTGMKDEGGWNQAHYEAMKEACEKQSAELIVKEDIAEGTGECLPVIDEFAEAGVKMIFLPGYAFGGEVMKYAPNYPDIIFYQIDKNFVGANVSCYFGRMYQARYLAGVVAGNTSTTNKIGYVAAMKNPEVIRGLDAFTLGVRSVNPEAQVYVKWVGSWDDEEKEKALAKELIETDDVDVLTYHQNKTYVVDVAEEYGIDSIGYHFDDSGRYSDHYLTSAVWDFSEFYQNRIREYMTTGKIKAEDYWDGVTQQIVKLVPFSPEVSEKTRQDVDAVIQKFDEGWDVFCGPIYDNKQNICVEDAEQLSDEYLQTTIYWLVEGVVE